MIPRRRPNEQNGNGTTEKPNGTTPALPISQPPTAASSFGSALGTRKNRRLLIMVLIMVTAGYWMTREEKKLLDEEHYEDARKEYLKKNSHHERYSTVHKYHRNPNAASGKFVLEPENEFTPGIAWLMSFPNSGTSFTMTMVARSTNKSFATNYGNEIIAPDEPNSLSIYPRRPEGPFWPGLSGKMHTPRELPDHFVITKTHCGSRCSKCGPDEYIETPEEFLRRCTLGHALLTPAKVRRKYDVEYPSERVQRAIHLIRNPMHNIIARYHLEHRHKGYKNDTNWQENHSNDAKGLHKWCDAFSKDYLEEDIAFFGSKSKIPKAPCHGEFYKWTQWHNLAHDVINIMRGKAEGFDFPPRDVPVHKVYYEDYNTKFEETANGILDFLDLKQVAPFREFTSRKDYGGYFPPEELRNIRDLVKSVASEETWSDVKHYFEDDVETDAAAAGSGSRSRKEEVAEEEQSSAHFHQIVERGDTRQ
ncbi:unnamed protein product [Pseudo-nitzschia multistriata]|uniref:Sulfotransferase domain-containing protein n=1 Tax=Pseudo-nitzschia multistriata TaxID=183589 RepID=A0A448Z9E7_9STRA|nr:unnamed protein product [Pseudo-nitzschia multistriata]